MTFIPPVEGYGAIRELMCITDYERVTLINDINALIVSIYQ